MDLNVYLEFQSIAILILIEAQTDLHSFLDISYIRMYHAYLIIFTFFSHLLLQEGVLAFLKKLIYLIYLFLSALGLCCCVWVFSSCGKQRLLFVAVRGLLILVASLVAEHGL